MLSRRKMLDSVPAALAIAIALLLLAFGAGAAYCVPDAHLSVRTGTEAPGYVLVAPAVVASWYRGDGKVLLLDERGKVAHAWKTSYPAANALLEPNGNLLVELIAPQDLYASPGLGTTGILEELDWNGKLLFRYDDPRMNHDFDALPDGSIVYTRWSPAPATFSARVVGGFDTGTTSVWTNELVRIDRNKDVLSTWRVSDHLDPARYPVNPNVPRSDWAHLNSVRYVPDNPLTHTAAYLVSIRDISEVLLVDAKSGNVLWQSPRGLLSLQHDATMLRNGDVQVFDNGEDRAKSPVLLSEVRQIDPRTDAEVGHFNDGTTPGEAVEFASSIMGGAEELSNGDIFETLSTAGRFLEWSAAERRVVWAYSSWFRNASGTAAVIFRARKYDPAGTAWGKRLAFDTFASHACSRLFPVLR